MKSLGRIVIFLAALFSTTLFAQPGGYFPPPSSVVYHNDTLSIFPPDSLPGDPVILLSYNILVDDEFYDNLPVTNPTEPADYIFDITTLTPGNRSFCVNAVYSLWISESACDTAQVFYGMELPVLEDWSSGSFETLQWNTDSENWVIDAGEGNPSPSASFLGNPAVTEYEISLKSFPMTAVGMSNGKIWLDFDIKLDANQPTGTEKLFVQVWNWVTQTWTTCRVFDNSEGGSGWSTEHLNIRSLSMNKIFKVRFLAVGENSAGINFWALDNIHIYRRCDAVYYLDLDESLDYNHLEWSGFNWINGTWLNWDDGTFSGTSIGTGNALEYQVAARWTPEQITYFNGWHICNVSFVPAESSASYNIRIWQGQGPDTLIVDQNVPSPIIGEWNTVEIVDSAIIDASKDLWIGYYINTPTGYPAGTDDGPAINGFGNMIYFQDKWSTLLDINPELNYNWNISSYIDPDPIIEDFWLYKICRKEDDGDYQIIDTTKNLYYNDSSIVLEKLYCYKVSAVWTENNDTCESDLNEEVCETLCLGVDTPEREISVEIYPNPASSWLWIESEDVIREIKLYNSLGETVMKLEIGNLEYGLDVSGLPAGIYFIEVKTCEQDFRSKILVTRQ
jgi:hypothetical protein